MQIGKYAKTVTAVVSGLIGWGVLVVNSPSTAVTAQEWISLATYLAIALGVYAVPNAANSDGVVTVLDAAIQESSEPRG